MKFIRCFDQSGIVGYTPEGRSDVAFVWKSSASPAQYDNGADLLAAWASAPVENNLRSRTIMFFNGVDPATFIGQNWDAELWGRMAYWLGGANLFFPMPGALSFIELRCVLKAGGASVSPNSLDELEWTWDATADALRISHATATWNLTYRDQPVSMSPWLQLNLSAPAGFPAGALCCPWKKEELGSLPIEVSFFRPKQTGTAFFDIQGAHAAPFLEALTSDPIAGYVSLDPRDRVRVNDVRDEPCVSRVEFAAGTTLIASYLDSRGICLRMRSSGSSGARGLARLMASAFRGILQAGNKWKITTQREVFRPEGDFELLSFSEGSGGGGAESGESAIEVLTGAAGTEFAPVLPGNLISFSPGPGTQKTNGLTLPPNSHTSGGLHDGNHHVLRSPWVSFGVAEDAQYVSEAVESPQFKVPSAGGTESASSTIERAKLPFAPFKGKALPIMPWAGWKSGNNFSVGNEEFETTHLSALRRELLAKTSGDGPPPPGGAGQESGTETFGVTPQGIICKVEGTAIRTLYFGDPAADAATQEFFVTFRNGDEAKYKEVQKALRADNIFLVVQKPENTVEVGTTVKIRDFTLNLELSDTKSILLIKYFKNKKLSELVDSPNLWACKEQFADGLTADVLKKKMHLGGSIPGTLQTAWNDPEWQGVIVLDLAPERMPDLFESLRAGMTKAGPSFHHIGLNSLSVTTKDVQTRAARRGSAFACVKYSAAAPSGDVEPGDPINDQQTGDAEPGSGGVGDRRYAFHVELLQLEIRNSQITLFKADVHVGFTHLFWDKTLHTGVDTRHYAKLIGAYEARPKPGGGTEDVFTLYTKDPHEIPLNASVLSSFTLQRAELTVRKIIRSGSKQRVRSLEAFIGMTGVLKFSDKAEVRDLFEVKSITLERTGLRIDYKPELKEEKVRDTVVDPAQQRECKLGFEMDSARADIDFGGAKNSMLSMFPVKLKGFRFAVGTPFNLPALKFWKLSGQDTCQFGFDLEIDLGFLGSLSGGTTKGLKLPALLGWSKGGGFAFGIQFPTWKSKIDIGIQGFIGLRAEEAEFRTCGAIGSRSAMAIVLKQMKLVFFGREWPESVQASCAIFVPVTGERKVSWAFSFINANNPPLLYLGGGHRIRPPQGRDAKALLSDFQTYFTPGVITDPCGLVGNNKLDPSENGWVVMSEFMFENMVHGWLVAADKPATYALRLEFKALPAISGELGYRRVSDALGIFSAEISLLSSLPPLQFGAVTVRLPTLRVEVHTNGSFQVDLGFPWNDDFRRSFQVEVGIFLGSGGFYFGMTTAEALDVLKLKGDVVHEGVTYTAPLNDELREYRALEAGIAFRVGIGRSIDLGLLRGEASISIFGGLVGAIAFKGKSIDPKLYSIEGYVGIMVHIWAEVDFLILKARAEILAYVKVGFIIRRVLARIGDTQGHSYLTLPVVLYAEIGLYVSFAVRVKIGCFWVTLFTLEFRVTWRFEETISGYSAESITGGAVPSGGTESDPAPFAWDEDMWDSIPEVPLTVYCAVLPCAAHGDDIGQPTTLYYPCAVAQPMVQVHGGLEEIAKFITSWALDLNPTSGSPIVRDTVMKRRKQLQNDDLWNGDNLKLIWEKLGERFDITMEKPPLSADPVSLAAIPFLPGLQWRFVAPPAPPAGQPPFPIPAVPVAQTIATKDAAGHTIQEDAGQAAMVDYLRGLADSTLSEFERLIYADSPRKDPKEASLTWGQLWTKLTQVAP